MSSKKVYKSIIFINFNYKLKLWNNEFLKYTFLVNQEINLQKKENISTIFQQGTALFGDGFVT